MRTSEKFFLKSTLPVLLVAAITFFAPSRCVLAESRVENGDMTLGEAVPEGWSIGYTGSGKLSIARDKTVFRSGPASLSLRSVDGPASGAAGHSLQAGPGAFTISGYIKASGELKDSWVAIQVFGGGKQIAWVNLAQIQPSEDWRPFSQVVNLPQGAEACQLVLTFTGNGQEWLDDVTTTEKTEQSGTPAGASAGSGPSPSVPLADGHDLPVSIAANDPSIRYVGRFDWTNPLAPSCAWSASTAVLRFRGTDLNVKLKESGSDRWEVEVDGTPKNCFSVAGGEHTYSVAAGLPMGEHVVRLIKATEPVFGSTRILGYQLNQGGLMLADTAPQHRLEVIGDSISTGYGNESHSKEEHFSPLTQNAYFTYGDITARALGADYVCVAWSGRCMWPKNTIPELYDRTLPQDKASVWDFAKWTPDVVVINLATNDFAGGPPDEAGWTQGYEAFISRVRKHYPHAEIYCAVGPMMGDWGKGKPLTTVRLYLARIIADEQAAGDTKVHFIEFPGQDIAKNGVGADWHPTVKTHEAMAQQLTAVIRKDLHW